MFYNFVKAMLVRNPKKRPSAFKMLSVSDFFRAIIIKPSASMNDYGM